MWLMLFVCVLIALAGFGMILACGFLSEKESLLAQIIAVPLGFGGLFICLTGALAAGQLLQMYGYLPMPG